MLRQIADDVLVHTSTFCQSNAVVVRGTSGVLVIDPGVRDVEMECLAADIGSMGERVVAGFSTHPHWDHLLWHVDLGDVPRYATPTCAAAIRTRMAAPGFEELLASMIPADVLASTSLDLLGLLDPLPERTEYLPWDGPRIRITEHQAHAPGHAVLLIEDSGVLVTGDMVSDVLDPILNRADPLDPVQGYRDGLQLLEHLAAETEMFVPGHGSVGSTAEMRVRIARDEAYLQASSDPR